MFKYLWIIITLVIPVICLICYTVNEIRKSFNDTIDYAEKVHNSNKDIKWILSEALSNFVYDHEGLCAFWGCLIVFGIVSLYVMSLTAYVQ